MPIAYAVRTLPPCISASPVTAWRIVYRHKLNQAASSATLQDEPYRNGGQRQLHSWLWHELMRVQIGSMIAMAQCQGGCVQTAACVPQVRKAVGALVQQQGWAKLPLYALGSSAGGALALLLALKMPLQVMHCLPARSQQSASKSHHTKIFRICPEVTLRNLFAFNTLPNLCWVAACLEHLIRSLMHGIQRRAGTRLLPT